VIRSIAIAICDLTIGVLIGLLLWVIVDATDPDRPQPADRPGVSSSTAPRSSESSAHPGGTS
jgi:hypothetical protein